MSSKGAGLSLNEGLPENMLTPIYSVQRLAAMVAADAGLDSGTYEVVVEFKLGAIQMKSDQGDQDVVPAMGVGIGGIGLRPAPQTPGRLTIDYVKKSRSKATRK